jgi:hypothetical protein
MNLPNQPERVVDRDVGEVRASLEATDLQARIARGDLPVADAPEPLAAGDSCHFVCPVRFGRRRADQFGYLVLTRSSLQFRGALDVSVAWNDVADVRRDQRDIVIGLHESRRVLRFACHSFGEAARGAVIADHLARTGRGDPPSPGGDYHASI